MILRQFLPSGVQAFKAFLATCRESPRSPIPGEVLENDALTESVKPSIIVEPKVFATRREAAEYLSTILRPLPEADVAFNVGLWSWLSLFFFNQVCPEADGYRHVKNDYSYVFEPKNPRHFYRHLLFIAWHILRVAPSHNRIVLDTPVSSFDEVTRTVMGRLYLTRIPCLFEVLDRLYWDAKRGKARAGIVTRVTVKPGDLRNRFPIKVRQLEKTYDLFTLSADQLIDLLGAEFHFQGDRKQRALF
jgi:hypothetical protein